MVKNKFCEFLEWDSEFFGYRIAKILQSQFSKKEFEEIRQWCRANTIDCAYALIALDDLATLQFVNTHEWQLVDLRITFERHIDSVKVTSPALQGSIFIRPSREKDIPHLQRIAAVSYHDTRFYYDPHFSSSVCDELYKLWIEKSCRGYADRVFVAEEDGCPVGYISCHLRERAIGQIGLVGVAAEASGRGIGTGLVCHATQWFRDQKMNFVSVVTQGRNVKAQRLYQKCGFLTLSVQLFYHYWQKKR